MDSYDVLRLAHKAQLEGVQPVVEVRTQGHVRLAVKVSADLDFMTVQDSVGDFLRHGPGAGTRRSGD